MGRSVLPIKPEPTKEPQMFNFLISVITLPATLATLKGDRAAAKEAEANLFGAN